VASQISKNYNTVHTLYR